MPLFAVAPGGSAVTSRLEFRVLGPLEVLADGRIVGIGGARQRIVLTMLLLEHGRVVSAGRLIEAVWGESPPTTARSQVQISVSALRRAFAELGHPTLITTRPTGYLLNVAEGTLDTDGFRGLISLGRTAARGHDLAGAGGHLRAALNLWRGPALANVESGLVEIFATRLNEERFTIHEECLELELALGRHSAVIAELGELVVTYPLREKLWAHLMLALHRAGRQSEALGAYRRARETLTEQIGLDPSAELRELEGAILRSDPSLDLVDAVGAVSLLGRSGRVLVPRQLPSGIPNLVGRDDSVRRIRGHLTPGACGGHGAERHVEVVVVGGRSGVGKTALALHVAHKVRGHYPGGHLFAHLPGDDVRPARTELILERFLRALGIAAALLPEGLEALAALYRSELAARRILVVLDDALTEEQVLPFVPGDAHSALLVTSRRPLPALQGVHRVDLDVLTAEASAALLRELMGENRVLNEPQAAIALAQACGHLPLALRVAGAKLSARRHWSIEHMVGRLADEGRRLDELSLGGVGVRSSIGLSYEGLGAQAAHLLLVLGLLGQADFAHWVAGPLLGIDTADADEALDELVQARLVEPQVGADREVRFHVHDLIRIFAVERLATDVPEKVRSESRHRLLRGWLFVAAEAQRREYGDRTVMHSAAARLAIGSDVLDGLLADPLAWFQSEQASIIAAVHSAAEGGHDDLCWDLALTAADFFESLGYVEQWKQTNDIALQAVRRADNKRGEAAMLFSRAGTAHRESRADDAQRDLLCALSWFDGVGDAHGRGLVLCDLAVVDRLLGEHEVASNRLESALDVLRGVSDPSGEAHVLNIMAKISIERGEHHEAEALLRQALEVCPPCARRVRAQLAYWIGETYRARGRLAEAETAFNGVLAKVLELNDPIGEFHALLGLGRVTMAMSELPPAEILLRNALAVSDDVGDRIGKCLILLAMVELALEFEDVDTAANRLAEYDTTVASVGQFDMPSEYADIRQRVRTATPSDRYHEPTQV